VIPGGYAKSIQWRKKGQPRKTVKDNKQTNKRENRWETKAAYGKGAVTKHQSTNVPGREKREQKKKVAGRAGRCNENYKKAIRLGKKFREAKRPHANENKSKISEKEQLQPISLEAITLVTDRTVLRGRKKKRKQQQNHKPQGSPTFAKKKRRTKRQKQVPDQHFVILLTSAMRGGSVSLQNLGNGSDKGQPANGTG